MQIQTIVKMFLLSWLVTRQVHLTEEVAPEEPVKEEVGEGYVHAVAAKQLKNVPTR